MDTARLRARIGAIAVAGLATATVTARALPAGGFAAEQERLRAAVGEAVGISLHRSTGHARFVRLPAASAGDLAPAGAPADPAGRARAFLVEHGGLFGVRDPAAELELVSERRDGLGAQRLDFAQRHRGVPVFGRELRAHFDARGRLRVVQGDFLPGLELDPRPRLEAAPAARRAREFVAGRMARPGAVIASGPARLVVHRPELGAGRLERPRLAWVVEAGDGGDVRALVFVDAVGGKVFDHLDLVYDALDRRAYSGLDQAPFDGIPDSWPDDPDWVEGDAYPTGVRELDGGLAPTADVHRFFAVLGRDSYDGSGHVLDVSWNRASFCPNASWNGLLASFCAGFAVHDVVAHEWAHAYTDYTHGLFYRWQSGALNEAYSDIWGEALDLSTTFVEVPDTDLPDDLRASDVCSGFVAARLRVTAPATVAGDRAVGTASFGPPPAAGPAVELVRADDGAGPDPHDACEPPVGGGLAGRLALADRGACDFETQARHVQAAGAVGLVVGNVASSPSPESPPAMGCDPVLACDLTITIPAVSLGLTDADVLRAALAAGPVFAAIAPGDNVGAADSVRWLLGEDVRPLGIARDMWQPTCLGAPGRVSDEEYHCTTSDNGGVHVNSGVPNHAFALLVDGGSAGGQPVAAIGLPKAIHVYWRAQATYQTPTTDFADHADALETACGDLIGVPLPDPAGGPDVTLAPADCAAVAAAMTAVEMRLPPDCDFVPILDPATPRLCEAERPWYLSQSTFESGEEGWTASRRAVADPTTFDPRDWTRESSLPEGASGWAFHAPDPSAGDCVTGVPDDDESGVLVLESPEMVIPIGKPFLLAFDHYVATEASWDGGNVKVQVGAGGPWRVLPAAAFTFNSYNGTLFEPPTNTDPLAGEEVFHGLDEGSNDGGWGTSIADLAGVVAPGQPFRIRFEFGTDVCFGTDLGWWVDDVRVATCVPGIPLFLDGFETGGTERWSATSP